MSTPGFNKEAEYSKELTSTLLLSYKGHLLNYIFWPLSLLPFTDYLLVQVEGHGIKVVVLQRPPTSYLSHSCNRGQCLFHL